MSRNYTTLIVLPLLILSGCALNQEKVKPIQQKTEKKIIQPYEHEDQYILYALDAKGQNDFNKSTSYFEHLYDKTKNIVYISEAIKNAIISKNNTIIKSLLEKALKDYPDDIEINRYLVAYYIDDERFKEAETAINKLLKLKKNEYHLDLAGIVQTGLENYELALKYFESSYKINQNNQTLIKLVNVLYDHLDRKRDAVALLETHSRIKGCSKITCYKLIQIYGKEQNLEGLISTYKQLYKVHKNDTFAQKIVELYIYKKDTKAAISFLQSTNANDPLLLDLYLSIKDYKNGLKIAKKIYGETNDLRYLGQIAILEYESSKNKSNKKILDSVSKKFEQVIFELDDGLYYNYYGYLLIDHDIDIHKGIELVKKALEKEPDSIFYLDSLAWGYYKIGKCKEAFDIMKTLIKQSDETEIVDHYEKIIKCMKDKDK